MVQPYNYALSFDSPADAFLKAVQVGQQQQQVENQRAQIKMKQDEAALAKQFQADVAAWTKNPTPEGHQALVAKYPSEFQTISGVQKSVEATERPAIISISRDALMAHRNKNPKKVVQLLDERIEAAKDNPVLQKKFMDMKVGYQAYSNDPKLQESLIASVLAQDEEGRSIYSTAFKQTEPYVVAGDNLYLKSDIYRAVEEAEKTGKKDIKVTPVIPMGAVSMLKSNPNTAPDFDKKYGNPANPNPSAQILGGQTGSAPSGNFR